MMAPGTYGKTWWRNGYACGCMIQSIEDIIEPRLRAAGYLGPSEKVTVYQYAYNSSVGASAGTHSGGGALDHAKASDGETKIWRECGVADWQRGTPEDTYFDDHSHGIWQGCPHLAGDAESQLDQYDSGCNGLADWGPDQSPHVAPISWQDAYDKYAGDGPADQGGLLGMTTAFSARRSADWNFAANNNSDGKWNDAVPINDDGDSTVLDYSKCKGAIVAATACLTISGLAEGEVVDVAWSIANVRSDGSDAQYSKGWANRRDPRRCKGTGTGYDTVELTFVGTLPKPADNRTSRLRIVYSSGAKAAVLGSATIEGGY